LAAAVERRLAGVDLAALERGLAAAERLAAVERAVPAAFEVADVAAGFLAAAPRARVPPLLAALRPRPAGFDAAGFASSAATRLVSASTSARRRLRSSSTRMSSIISRTRPAAPATSSTRSWARVRVDCALSAVAWKVRSTAVRTAPTASAGFLSFLDFFLSFFAMRRESSSMPSPMASAPIHLRPNAPVAERALLPGDPGRALRLAQHLLAAPMQVLNTNRGLWGYTGTATDGAALTIQSTGMGGPSAAIVAEELIALGARRLVRTGTCGALVDPPRIGDLLVAGEALCEDGASRALGAAERAAADPALSAALARVAGAPVAVVSADLFYDPDPERAGRWAAAGAVAVELESAALFTVARLRGARAACVLLVTDELAGGERIGDDALVSGEIALGEAGLAGLA
jgi:uridine phosphorylase